VLKGISNSTLVQAKHVQTEPGARRLPFPFHEYAVTRDGDVWSHKRRASKKLVVAEGWEADGKRYDRVVTLCVAGAQRNYEVGELVASAWAEGREEYSAREAKQAKPKPKPKPRRRVSFTPPPLPRQT